MTDVSDADGHNEEREEPGNGNPQPVEPVISVVSVSELKTFFDFKFSTIASIALTVALFFVAASQLAVYKKQTKLMGRQTDISRGQLAISQSDHRPWAAIGANPQAASDLTYLNGTGSLSFLVEIRNFSKTPATGIYTNAGAYVHFNAQNVEE
ncbi:MAG TPA: hypothetical protein VKS78_12210, partial [Roseiarcus sp.]|nr:hypothetical protein [Roseiarcus sp.]